MRLLICPHLFSMQTHSGSVWRVTWAHPEFGQVLASCSFDRTAAVWEEIVGESNDKQRGLSHWVRTTVMSGNVAVSTQCSTRQSVENPYDDLSFNVCVSVGHFGWNTFETIASVLFSDQENHAGGQSHFSDRCEVCPQTHGSDAGHLLCRRRGEDLRGSGRDEP